jgi:hypothetical protein
MERSATKLPANAGAACRKLPITLLVCGCPEETFPTAVMKAAGFLGVCAVAEACMHH